MLDHSKLAYAQLVAANALKKLLLQSWNHLTVQQRIDFRNYVLTYLANHGPDCQAFVNASLVQLVGRMTKLGWLDANEHQQIVTEVRVRDRVRVRVRVRVRDRDRVRVRVRWHLGRGK